MKKSINSIMLLFILSASFICLSSQLHAQGWSWGRGGSGGTIDSWPIACDPSGNIYAGGLATNRTTPIDFGYGVTLPPYPSTAYYQTMWIKYNSAGVPLWAGCTSSGTTFLYNICSDPGGNLILFGSFTSATMTLGSFTLTNSYGGSAAQYFLVKIDPTGTILWAIADGNINPSYYSILTALICSAGGVTTDEAGNIYITSSFIKPTMTIGSTTLTNTDASGSSYDIFVAKYSPAGVPLWATSVGGPRNDYGFGITVASTGLFMSQVFTTPLHSILVQARLLILGQTHMPISENSPLQVLPTGVRARVVLLALSV